MEPLDTKHPFIIKKTSVRNARIILKAPGKIFVNVPYFYTQQDISELLKSHNDWIEKHLQKMMQSDVEIQNILYEHQDEILIFGTWQKVDKNLTKKYLKKILFEYIHLEVAKKAGEMGLAYGKVNIRENKSTLGSCSQENNLNFSLLLVCANPELIDYVIIHELSHIIHKNHSRNFWECVENYCENWKQKRSDLKKDIRLYIALLDRLNI